jgi:hypothetical protein
MKHRLARFRVALKLANLSIEIFAARVDSNASLLLRILKRRNKLEPTPRRQEVLASVDAFINEQFRLHREILDLERCP